VGRFYLSTPIYYVNDAPHLGHAYTMVVADAVSRWHRLAGDDVFFLTGTDEHGAKVAQAASEHGLAPKVWADQLSERFREAWRVLGISNDDFIRTTEPRHYRAVQSFLGAIRDNGYIYSDTYRGPYCVACEAYYAEDELVDGCCPVHQRPVEVMEEENYFFRLSAFADRLLEYYDRDPSPILPATRLREAAGFVRGGLKDISVTRTSIDWGVPVPWDDRHVFYVWYDALVNYLTAIGYGSDPDRFARWWPAVHHLIGKDILRFHCVWWPAMCMAAGIDPPLQVVVHGWLLVGGEKMSKTRLNQIFPADLVAEHGVDAVRYYLLRDTTLGADGDFSAEGLVARYNTDLANNLGNLVARVATVADRRLGGVGPAPGDPATARLAGVAAEVTKDAAAAWERFAPDAALEATWRLLRETNAELEAREPWKAPEAEATACIGDALEALRIVSLLVSPAMPATAAEVWSRIGLEGRPDAEPFGDRLAWGGYPGGRSVVRRPPLFPRRTE